MKIIGIDPGSLRTGYGFLIYKDGDISKIEQGVITMPPKNEFLARIHELGQQLRDLFRKLQPDVVAVEKIFFGKNADSAFKLGHTRGVCLYEASLAGASVVDYAAREVKKGITGHGDASKEQVQLLLKSFFKIEDFQTADASDALALAVYHTQRVEVKNKLNLLREAQP